MEQAANMLGFETIQSMVRRARVVLFYPLPVAAISMSTSLAGKPGNQR